MSVELGSEQPVRRRLAVPETLIALGLLLFAGLALLQIWAIPASPIYASVGPTAFPYAVVAGLAILAMLMLVEAVRGGWQPEEERAVRLDWRALGYVSAGLLANVLLITWAGFTLASTTMFVLIAYGFGSRRPLRDAAIGFVVALAAYFGFAKALGVNIGGGLFERLLGG